MKKIIYYEAKKVLHNKLFMGLVLIFLCVNGYKISQLGVSDPTINEGKNQLYQELKGEMTDDKIEFVVDNYVKYKTIIDEGTYSREENKENTYTGYVYGDYIMFLELFTEWKELYEYQYYCQEIVQRASENVLFYREKNNTFSEISNLEIAEKYSGREVQNYYHREATERYLEYDFSSVFIILLILLVSSELIFIENKTKMNYVIDCSSFGGMRLIEAKLMFLVTFTAAISVLFYVADFFFFHYFYGMEGMSDPLFSIMSYKNTPINWSVFVYQILAVLIKIIGFLFFAVLTFLFSYLLLNQIYTVVFSALSFIVFVFVCENTRWLLNPVLLLINHNLFSGYHAVNIFNRPVSSIVVYVVVVVLGIMGMVSLLLIKNRGTNISERLMKKGI